MGDAGQMGSGEPDVPCYHAVIDGTIIRPTLTARNIECPYGKVAPGTVLSTKWPKGIVHGK